MDEIAQRFGRGQIVARIKEKNRASGIFTRLAASIGRTRMRWESNASEGSTEAGLLADVISVRSVTSNPLFRFACRFVDILRAHRGHARRTLHTRMHPFCLEHVRRVGGLSRIRGVPNENLELT